jgi:hypothetical protein
VSTLCGEVNVSRRRGYQNSGKDEAGSGLSEFGPGPQDGATEHLRSQFWVVTDRLHTSQSSRFLSGKSRASHLFSLYFRCVRFDTIITADIGGRFTKERGET